MPIYVVLYSYFLSTLIIAVVDKGYYKQDHQNNYLVQINNNIIIVNFKSL